MRLTMLAVMAAWLLSGAAYAQNCSDIRPRICSLKTPYEPAGSDADSSPTCDTGAAPSDEQKNTIQAAYDFAPSVIKAELCKVTTIFVIQGDPRHSWGKWEDPVHHPSGGGDTQIAIHKDNLAQTFSQIQDDHLQALNLDAHAKHPVGTLLPQRVAPQTLGLFYLLAHELGHIRWHKDAAIGEPLGCPDEDANFFSWDSIVSAKTNRWATFGKDDLGGHKTHTPKPKQVNNSEKLKSIYTGGFVTALAATNPEEDFVETYSIRALMEVCPACIFNITIGTGVNAPTIRVNDDGGHPVLRAKFNCVYNKYIK